MMWSTSFLADTEENCVSKNLDETVCLQFERRDEWIQEIRREQLSLPEEISGGNPLELDKKEEKEYFLPDEPKSVR